MSIEIAEFSIPDHAELAALARFLGLAVPGLQVERSAGRPGPGQQGALDWVTIAASSSVISTAIKVLPRFLEARKPGLSVEVKVKGSSVSVSGANLDEAMQVIDRALDD